MCPSKRKNLRAYYSVKAYPASTIRLDIPVLDFNKLLNLTLQNADPRPSGKFLGVRYNIDDELVGISTTVEQR